MFYISSFNTYDYIINIHYYRLNNRALAQLYAFTFAYI